MHPAFKVHQASKGDPDLKVPKVQLEHLDHKDSQADLEAQEDLDNVETLAHLVHLDSPDPLAFLVLSDRQVRIFINGYYSLINCCVFKYFLKVIYGASCMDVVHVQLFSETSGLTTKRHTICSVLERAAASLYS